MAVKTKKRLAYEEKEYEEKVEVTYEESEIRLIVLLLIFATCFLTLSTAFLLIANRLFGLYKESKIVHFTPEKRIGFPVPRKLFIAPNGKLLVYDFVENSFGELKNLQKLPSKDTETKFAFEFDGNIYFISTDKNKNVVQYNIKQRNHRELKNTKIPEPDNVDHLEISLNYGFQIGQMFWIVQGEIDSRKIDF